MEEFPEKKENDLPQSIIVILVVLAVGISILGTFTVVNELNKLNSARIDRGTPVQTGTIQLNIIDPNAKTYPTATGKLVFVVEDREEN
jgi:hypothetical protein